MTCLHRLQQAGLVQLPDDIRYLLRIAIQEHLIGRLQRFADRGDFQIGQYAQYRLGFRDRGLIVGRHPQTIGPQGIDAEVHQPVVAAEKRQVVGAPEVTIIRPGAIE